MTPCPYCGTPMTNPRRKQCGEPPCQRAYNAERMRRFFAGWKASTGERYEDRFESRRPAYERQCAVCSETWQATQKTAQFCSLACRNTALAEKARLERRLPVPYLPPCYRLASRVIRARFVRSPHRNIAGPRRWFSGQCRRCDIWFITIQPEGSYCSMRCQRSDAKIRRRAREREAYVAHVRRRRIFERDDWTCRLCGAPVEPRREVPHPLAPTIDHVIPLARGGTHEPDNVQCAHFMCNSIKSDRTLSEMYQ